MTKIEPGKLPWDYKDEIIEVACSGKAFKYIIENKDTEAFTLHSVIKKASVFARMGPDDKATLVF